MSTIQYDIQKQITQTAFENGVHAVGYTKIRQVKPVIVLGFPFSDKWFIKYPFYITKRLGEEYLANREVHKKITRILRKEGYTSHSKTVLSVYGDIRPLAVSAGIGNWGKNGLVVNNVYGSKLLFSAIFTNAPLQDSSGISDMTKEQVSCTICNDRCIKSCPAQAFSAGELSWNRCLPHAIKGCAECLQHCNGLH